jgi:hypothetical protein
LRSGRLAVAATHSQSSPHESESLAWASGALARPVVADSCCVNLRSRG